MSCHFFWQPDRRRLNRRNRRATDPASIHTATKYGHRRRLCLTWTTWISIRTCDAEDSCDYITTSYVLVRPVPCLSYFLLLQLSNGRLFLEPLSVPDSLQFVTAIPEHNHNSPAGPFQTSSPRQPPHFHLFNKPRSRARTHEDSRLVSFIRHSAPSPEHVCSCPHPSRLSMLTLLDRHHPSWVFWFRQQRAPGNKITSYEEGIKKIASFSSVSLTFTPLQSLLILSSRLNPSGPCTRTFLRHLPSYPQQTIFCSTPAYVALYGKILSTVLVENGLSG